MKVEETRQGVSKFDRWAQTYDQGRMTSWFRGGQARAIDALVLQGDDWLLDVGCGTGWAVLQTAQLLPRGRACGIDFSPGMVSRATHLASNTSNVEFKVGDAQAIPYPDGQFNAVICTNSFHHYPQPVRALRDMWRVLKPGGRLVIRDSDRGACLWVALWDLWNRSFEKGHVQYYTLREVFTLFREAGITRTELVSTEHAHFRKGKMGGALYTIRARKG